MSQQQNKKRKNFSKTLKAQIKRKPHTQPINGIQYTYGLLQKKSQSSLFNNQRFLLIKGIQTFGYASKLPDNVNLPFFNQKNIPKCKIQIPLQKIQISNQKQILVVQFKQNNKKQKTKWEFKCASKAKAIQWRQKLQGAKDQKINSQQNTAIKIILEDPNQSLDDSVRNTKDFKIQLEEPKDINPQSFRKSNKEQKSQNKSMNIEKQKQAVKDDLQNNSVDQNQIQNNQKILKFQPNLNSLMEKLSKNNKQESSQSQDQSNSIKMQNLKAKQIYQRKKQQQNNQFQQITEINNSFLSPLLNTALDSKFQIQNLKKQWGYEFAKGQNQFETVQHFKIYVQTIFIKIVDELSFQKRKRFYKPIQQSSQSIKYQIDSVKIEIFLLQLDQINSFHEKGTVIGNQKIKLAYQQHKNYDYVLQLTNNKGRIRVPLTMCVQYKGFMGLAKVVIPESQSYQNIEPLQKQLQLLQAQSRINNSVFEDPEHGRIVPLQNKIYEKLSRIQNNSRKFDICYLQSLKYYLPQDFYRFNKIKQGKFLRKQLIQDEQYEETIFNGQNMLNIINRLKIPQNLKQGVEVLTQVSKSISDRVDALVSSLENLDQIITNSKDLSKLMHGYGLNMRYLGILFQRSKQNWLKGIVISQISARCAKYFLKFDLQNFTLNLNQSKIQNIRKMQIKLIIQFLNKLLGNTQLTQTFWNQLSKQSQTYFQCFVDKSLINIGFFIQALQHHLRIKLTKINNQIQFFKSPHPIQQENFASFQIKSKTYDLSFTQLYLTINSHLKQFTQEAYEQLSILLNLQRKKSLPTHFNMNDFYQKIVLFMINWIPPHQGKQLYFKDQIQFGQILPNKALYQIKLAQIKWFLKQKNQMQSQKIRDWIIQHINRWIGEYHPILSQLYDLFSRYYLQNKHEQKKSVNYCKSGIKNQEKLLGQSHLKLADNYYMLSSIYANWQKKTEALNSLRRAKQILQESQAQDSEPYGVIVLKIGQLLLASNSIKQALSFGLQSYAKLNETQSLENIIQSIQLIGRCYQISQQWTQYVKFCEQISIKLNKLYQNAIILQRCVKIILMPYFKQLSKNVNISKRLLSVLQNLPQSSFSSNLAYDYLKQKIESEKSFPNQFINQLDELQEILDDIQTNGIIARWKGFQNVVMNKSLLNKLGTTISIKGFNFLATLQALNIFLGEGFIQGSLLQA